MPLKANTNKIKKDILKMKMKKFTMNKLFFKKTVMVAVKFIKLLKNSLVLHIIK